MTEETLFHEALAKANPQDRAAFLDAACGGDHGDGEAFLNKVFHLTTILSRTGC